MTIQRQVIVVGGGRVGRHVATQLRDEQNAVTVIELDEQKCTQIAPSVSRVIEGDATDPEILAEAAPEEAAVVAALTNDTSVNLSVCEMAAERNPDARTIIRVARDGEREYGHRSFVDDVVYPAAAGAEVAVDRITKI